MQEFNIGDRVLYNGRIYRVISNSGEWIECERVKGVKYPVGSGHERRAPLNKITITREGLAAHQIAWRSVKIPRGVNCWAPVSPRNRTKNGADPARICDLVSELMQYADLYGDLDVVLEGEQPPHTNRAPHVTTFNDSKHGRRLHII